MEVKPGYKLTEVGVIPEDWSAEAIDSLGGSHAPAIKAGPFGSSLKKDSYVSIGFKVYGQEQVIRGDIFYGDYFIPIKKYNELETCTVKSGDILLSLVGTVGKLLAVPENAPKGIINPRLIRFSFDHKKVDSCFFKNLFESTYIQALLDSSAQGGTMSILNASMLRQIRLPLPPLPEQTAIATTLSDVDALISSLDALISKKKQIKQGTMQELLSGKRRLPGFGGEWGVRRLGDVAVLHKENVIPNATPDKTFTHFSLPSYDQGKEPVVELGLSIGSNKFRVISGAVLISKLNPRIPRIWVPLIIPEDSVASTEFLVLTPKECITRNYLYVLLTSPRLQEQMELAATGTTGSHQRIGPEHVLKLVLHVPNAISEQQAIATILSDMDAEITTLEARRDKTKLLKQGMMQELLTGRIRLPMEHSTVSVKIKPALETRQ